MYSLGASVAFLKQISASEQEQPLQIRQHHRYQTHFTLLQIFGQALCIVLCLLSSTHIPSFWHGAHVLLVGGWLEQVMYTVKEYMQTVTAVDPYWLAESGSRKPLTHASCDGHVLASRLTN